MAVIPKIFIGPQSRLNLDDSPHLVGKTEFIQALNITRDQGTSVFNDDEVIANIKGNRFIPFNLPLGSNKVIGAFPDTLRNCVYEFVYNSDGWDTIIKYDNATRTRTKVLQNLTDTGGINILNFNVNYKVNHINVVHRDEDEGDLIYWTDGYNKPRGMNVQDISNGFYGVVEEDYINAAKKPPLTVATVAYGNDNTITTNSLRKSLYKFKYRWVYKDFQKSTWSMISEVPLPVDADDPDIAKDPTYNNYITVQVETGNKDVTAIEISVQSNLNNLWSDFFLATSLVKTDLSIADNSVYQFSFYNDGVYPALDVSESNLLFTWLPLLAKSQTLANGNVLVYGAITENYDPLQANQLEVALTVANVKNTGEDLGAPSIGASDGGSGGSNWTFTITGDVPIGTFYRIVMNLNGIGVTVMNSYTSIGGDTPTNVAGALYAATSPTYQASYGGTFSFILNVPAGSSIVQLQVIPGSGGGITTINSPTTWNWNSKYRFGLVYFDAWGRTNGVIYNATFDVNTPNISVDGGVPETPVITASIGHVPPIWAVKFMWARTNNLSYQSFLYYLTCDFQEDTDYYYFGLQNIKYFYDLNTTFIYPQLTVNEGDRIRVMTNAGGGTYTSNVYTDDYEILGVEERELTGGVPADVGNFVKVRKPTTPPSPAYGVNLIVMLYTPAKNTTAASNTVFYEFGQTYDIYEDSGNRYHMGLDQDQTAVQPAIFTFTGGDIYYRGRTMYYNITAASVAKADNIFIMDANYNDFFLSAVNGNGRPEIIDVNAQQQYFPTLVRFSQAYQNNTNINGLNIFFFENFDEYNRDYGDILKLDTYASYMKVGQKFRIGNVPIFLQIVKDQAGTDSLTISDRLLNQIVYYQGDFGVGDAPEAWARNNFAVYFCDTNRGVICRLSQDGITPISYLYKVNSWAIGKLPLRNAASNAKIYGVFNAPVNRYEVSLEAVPSDPAYTMAFDEINNAFEGERSYQPDMFCCLGTLLISYKDGQTWTHDSTVYNNFYGIQYESSITAVFNENPLQKKTFVAVTQVANYCWDCPEIVTNINSISPLRIKQQSNLILQDFTEIEGNFNAAILGDSNSPGGLINGDTMKGVYMTVKFRAQNFQASRYMYLGLISARYLDSPLNVVN